MQAWKKLFTHRKFFLASNICVGFVIAMIPPAIVVYHRWLDHPDFEYIINTIWSSYPFLKQFPLPSYFLIIVFTFICSIYIFSLLAIISKVRLPNPLAEPVEAGQSDVCVPARQKRTGTRYLITGGICLAIVSVFSIIKKTIPGIELLGIVFLFICGLILKETSLEQIKLVLKKHAGWVAAYTAIYSVALVLLQSLFNEKEYQLGAGVIVFFIAAVIMIRWTKSIPVVLWISLGALILYAWDINPWHYYILGVEFEFYAWAVHIATSPFLEVCQNILHAVGAIATHNYIVSAYQAFFMKIFGVSNFAWRISNPVILSAAVVCFYLFFRKFTKQSTSLVVAGLLACSSYLMNFGKIGYDNPQAFFMSGLTLWLAAEAVFSRRLWVYALLGLAMGFCFYSYPSALYILPIAVLLLAMFDFPKNKAAIRRWAYCAGMACIIVIPLVVQPNYYTGKSEGLFIHYPDLIARFGLGYIFGSNLLYSFFSYLYIVSETSFVTASHIDPISAVWVPIGMAWMAVQLRRHKFALFWMLSFLIMWFLAGVSHGRMFPPETRMLMLLPWWFSFAAFGITWMAEWVSRVAKSAFFERVIPIALMILIVPTNLVQDYWLVPRRYAGRVSYETVFLRFADREDHDPGKTRPYYLFVTDERWLIEWIQTLQGAYHTPQSETQLNRVVITGETPEPDQLVQILASDTIVIPQTSPEPVWREALTAVLLESGKVVCKVRRTPGTDIIFTAYLPPDLSYMCPYYGNWSNRDR